jgi:hypothetical protein
VQRAGVKHSEGEGCGQKIFAELTEASDELSERKEELYTREVRGPDVRDLEAE